MEIPRRKALLITLLLTSLPCIHAEVASIQEIPYYLKKLQEADTEGKRMEFNKIIHDAVVSADLSDKKNVAALAPLVPKIQIAIEAGLDRSYLEENTWLASAVSYFNREKNRPTVSIPKSDWLSDQTTASNGNKIVIYPEKIFLIEEGKTKVIEESNGIHEAVISPDGRMLAFIRKAKEALSAEVWVVNLKNLKRKKVSDMASCESMLFSIEGNHLYLKEKSLEPDQESTLYKISVNGGKLKSIGRARSLDTLVAKGKYKGALIVYRSTLHHMGVAHQECPVAWDESGKELGRLKDEACR